MLPSSRAVPSNSLLKQTNDEHPSGLAMRHKYTDNDERMRSGSKRDAHFAQHEPKLLNRTVHAHWPANLSINLSSQHQRRGTMICPKRSGGADLPAQGDDTQDGLPNQVADRHDEKIHSHNDHDESHTRIPLAHHLRHLRLLLLVFLLRFLYLGRYVVL